MAEANATDETASSSSSSSAVSSVRLWRTAFLTLRDEMLTSPPPPIPFQLVNQLIFSQTDALLATAHDLPSHEVTSDVIFLIELARNTSTASITCSVSESQGGDGPFLFDDVIYCFMQFPIFIHGVITRASLEMSSTSWNLVLDSFRIMIDILHGKGEMKPWLIGDVSRVRAIKQILEIVRYLYGSYKRPSIPSENKRLLEILFGVLACCQMESIYSYTTCNHRISGYHSLLDVHAFAFTMVSDIYSRVGCSLTVDIWQSTVEVLRKIMDALASKCLLVEHGVMARFYNSLLQCLHLVLVDPKGTFSCHVASLVAALRMFLHYGLSNKNHLLSLFGDCNKQSGSVRLGLNRMELKKSAYGPYRPPHLRKKHPKDLCADDEDRLTSSESESSAILHTSSDSDCSDSDGSSGDTCSILSAKIRLAAIVCVQDLCRADPKSFTAYWTMLLPSNDVLQPRKYEANLMSCLLFDPYIKARIASAATINAMLDGPASLFLQVAEYKESTKCGSFTALSSSLGHILMQLHSGILYIIKHETNGGLLASSFKVLTVLTSSTPYSRMPADLLPAVVSSIRERIEEGFASRSDYTSLMVAAINCLTTALSASPPSTHVEIKLFEESSKGSLKPQSEPGILSTLIRHLEPVTNPSISLEALKALKAVAHNYPSLVTSCWQQVSYVVYGFLSFSGESQAISWRANAGSAVGAMMGERVITAAVKVLDECLRAISGFKGTEDLSDEKLFDDPFTADCVKTKTISSAPYFGSETHSQTNKYGHKAHPFGSEQWSEAIIKHIPLGLQHSSSMVRAATVTCFAGITSSVFFALPKERQDVILNSSIKAALRDEIPSVRSAACRAIGIIACFPQIFLSVNILDQCIGAAEHNTHDSQISVRIAASWALANICDSLSHCITADTFKKDLKASSQLISLLIDSALRLAEDNDKIKANGVRALGNLSRYVPLTSASLLCDEEMDRTFLCLAHNGANNMATSGTNRDTSSSFEQASIKVSLYLERMVQAFLSCVTTGNVKVQWNVCHALSNLFCNKTVKLQHASWAPTVFSILLLLLRDSSNFKIRIQAAAALAVPGTLDDYGRSFYDVLKSVEHIIESSSSGLISTPSNFKYKVALDKQLTSTLLHVLGLTSRASNQTIVEFLVKKASFLEEWLTMLRAYLEEETSTGLEGGHVFFLNEKKKVISRAIRSLVDVFEGSNHHVIAQKFKELAE